MLVRFKLPWVKVLALLLLSVMAVATCFADESEYISTSGLGSKHVEAELVFDFESLQVLDTPSGKIARIGVNLKVEKGWHIYWKNPGEAGKATEIKWNLPEGWRTGELQWPYPVRLIEKGDIKTYAYSDEVLIFADLIIPPIVPERDEKVTFGAEISFLVCLDRCIPGKISLSREILLSLSNAEVPSKFYKNFEDATKQVPQESSLASLKEIYGIDSYLEKINELAFELIFKAPNSISEINFFDLDNEHLTMKSEVAEDGNSRILKINLTTLNPNRQALSGLFVWKDANSVVRAYEVKNFPVSELTEAEPRITENLTFKPNKFLTHSEEDILNGEEVDEDLTNVMGKTMQSSFSGGLLFALFSAFIGGIVLNFMPCVLPVLSIKLFGLIKAKSRTRKENIVDASYFAAGILLSFVVFATVAVLLKAGGKGVGWGFQFQSPEFVFGMIVFLFFIALTFFDFLNITLPFSGRLNNLGKKGDSSRVAKNLADGFLISALSTPCTAPFLGAALAFAFSQDYLTLFSIFIMIGVGLAFPYFVISANPRLLKFFPEPGNWMQELKHLMGFALIATIIWLTFVISKLIPGSWLEVSIILFDIGVICWLLKILVSLKKRGFIAIILVTISIAVSIHGYRHFQDLFADHTIPKDMTAEIDWQDYNSVNLDSITRPVLIDFTADWCITCKFNEKFILSDGEIVALLKEKDFLPLKADWTSGDEQVSQGLKRFKGDGVPLYVLTQQRDGKPIKEVILGPILTKQNLLNELRNF